MEASVNERVNGSPVTGAVAGLAGALMIAGAVLPWYRVTVDLESFGAPGQGSSTISAGAMQSTALVVALVGIAILAAGGWLLTSGPGHRFAVPLAAVGTAVVAVTLVSAFQLQDEQLGGVLQLQGLFGADQPFTESLGIGVWLSVAGGVVCVASGVLASRASRNVSPTSRPDAPVSETFEITD
jgi:hypothetical protein